MVDCPAVELGECCDFPLIRAPDDASPDGPAWYTYGSVRVRNMLDTVDDTYWTDSKGPEWWVAGGPRWCQGGVVV